MERHQDLAPFLLTNQSSFTKIGGNLKEAFANIFRRAMMLNGDGFHRFQVSAPDFTDFYRLGHRNTNFNVNFPLKNRTVMVHKNRRTADKIPTRCRQFL